MTHDEMIAVIAAHRDGAQVQAKGSDEDWHSVGLNLPSWDFKRFEYRIKPEPPKQTKPREWWLLEFTNGLGKLYINKESALFAGYGAGYGGRDLSPFHVREVLPEPAKCPATP